MRHNWVAVPVGLAVALWLTIGAAAAEQGPVQIEVADPRPFGYVVGDLLRRTVHVEAERPWVLPPESLPKTGRVDPWLELRDAQLVTRAIAQRTGYDLTLTYQLLNSPEAMKLLELPRVELRFRNGASAMVQEVPPLLFTAAPVSVPYATADRGLGDIRADKPPSPIATRPLVLRLALNAGAIVAILLYFAYVRLCTPLIARANQPFARAYRELKRLRQCSVDEATLRTALRRVHRAFDETAGTTLFAEQLEAFFAHNARFGDLRSPTEQFFQWSRRVFFEEGATDEAPTLEPLVALCKLGRDLERGAG